MSDFEIWFFWGMKHILDIGAYDHILFVAILTLSFPVKEWKKLLGLITAFTIGHSLTLALSVLDILHLKREYCELLIAITLLISATALFLNKNTPYRVMAVYAIICCFGLIHGMGFSFTIKSVSMPGESIAKPLFYFNCGIEVGQIIVVAHILLFSLILTRFLKVQFIHVQKAVALVAGLFALGLCVLRTTDIFNS